MDLNKIMLIGRVGKDPELKTVGGKNLSNFSVATSYGSGDTAKTEWHNVTCWEKLSELAQNLLHKGDKVYIEGRLSYNVVGEGENRKTFAQITATNFINLTGKPAGSATGTSGAGQGQTAAAKTKTAVEDIPF